MHRKLQRIINVAGILSKYPVTDVSEHDGHLVIELKRGTEISQEDEEQLNMNETFNQTVEHCWEVFL